MHKVTVRSAYVVLGSSGRLGQRLLTELKVSGYRVIGISRTEPEGGEVHADWIPLDITATAEWGQTQRQLVSLLDGVEEVILADLVLDRTSVTTMRRSIRCATDFTVQTEQVLVDNGLTVRVVSANTTASLAPVGLRTPYGRVKRDQATRYARLGRIDVVMLPQLREIDADESIVPSRSAMSAGDHCSYSSAARCLIRISGHPAGRSLWVVRGDNSVPTYVQRGLAGLPSYVIALVLSRTVGRDSPAAHRMASREGLGVIPVWIRRRVDHHGAPERLVREFAGRLKMSRAQITAVSAPPAAPDCHN